VEHCQLKCLGRKSLIWSSRLFTPPLGDIKVLSIPHVEVPDGNDTLVSEDVNEGAGGGVHYVAIEQDPDQSPEDCLTACASEGKPRF
jgi:hypothetical protein